MNALSSSPDAGLQNSEMDMVHGTRFAFGKNWQSFVRDHLNQERVEEAKKSLVEFCDGNNLITRKTFIDIGCGSGLFSLVAHQLGACKVVSLDIDPHSVSCCKSLREREGNAPNWEIQHGSILDQKLVSSLGKYDFVYSWGVLHHTGSMWQAIENASNLVAQNGAFCIGIYNKADAWGMYPDGRFGPSRLWVTEKKLYSRMPLIFQNLVDFAVMSALVVMYILTFSNPIKKIRSHKSFRGMSWRIDIKDWLGGYPYEYASVDEVFHFMKERGFSLENLKCNPGLMNNEFLFRRL
jgi:2-polyprenyl-6-hydroxyphenyl methylase/3-demethylubiquinone-9 3-methyltransferase